MASQLRSDFDSTTLVQNHHFRSGTSPTPLPAGSVEKLWINIPANDTNNPQLSYAIALKVFDDEGKGSEVSNIAQFTFIDKKYIVTKPDEPTTDTAPGIQTTESNVIPYQPDPLTQRVILIVAISSAILALVIVVIIILACCFCNKNCRRQKDDTITIHMHPEPETIQHPPQNAYQMGRYPPDPPPSYYSQSPNNRPAPALAMRSTVRRELEELEQLPSAPAPPPPRPRNRNIWGNIKGSISNSR